MNLRDRVAVTAQVLRALGTQATHYQLDVANRAAVAALPALLERLAPVGYWNLLKKAIKS